MLISSQITEHGDAWATASPLCTLQVYIAKVPTLKATTRSLSSCANSEEGYMPQYIARTRR